eukprot:scaffold177622_cov30-Tisochrysis_lutea.AAC.2
MMNTPRPKPRLRNFEATTVAQEDVLSRDAHIVEVELTMAVRRIFETQRLQWAHDFESWGVHWDEDHRVACVTWLTVILELDCSAQEDADLAVGVARASDPPLSPVEHKMVAVDAHSGLCGA